MSTRTNVAGVGVGAPGGWSSPQAVSASESSRRLRAE
jgi:hypothetical protein